MKSMKLRVALLFLALFLVSPLLLLDALIFAAAAVLNRNNTRPRNIFMRISEFISDYIFDPWFSLFGVWEDSDPCS